jgi:hypothetical protein
MFSRTGKVPQTEYNNHTVSVHSFSQPNLNESNGHIYEYNVQEWKFTSNTLLQFEGVADSISLFNTFSTCATLTLVAVVCNSMYKIKVGL